MASPVDLGICHGLVSNCNISPAVSTSFKCTSLIGPLDLVIKSLEGGVKGRLKSEIYREL